MLRQGGGEYFNPDEVAAELRRRDAALQPTEANALAWRIGVRQLDRAVQEGLDYFFETTLGGRTITERLHGALAAGCEVRIWYAALDSPQRHIARVATRVKHGGHDIPEPDIRKRYDSSRRNLISLLPQLTELRLFDNSFEADPNKGSVPKPRLVLHVRDGKILAPKDLSKTPEWAKPIVAQAMKHAARR